MLVVNLFGSPGAGKSTGAAYVFSELKLMGINAELVTEFAKDKVWEESKAVFQDQLYILGKQNFRLSRINGKVDVAVTDSPIVLSAFYNNQDMLNFNPFVFELFNSYNNLNFFITRCKPYNPAGRFQSEEESDRISERLSEMLTKNNIDFTSLPGNEDSYAEIVQTVANHLSR